MCNVHCSHKKLIKNSENIINKKKTPAKSKVKIQKKRKQKLEDDD